MKKRIIFSARSASLTLALLALQSCGGGATPTTGAPETQPTPTPTFSVLSVPESPNVSDGLIPRSQVDPYAVELDGVLVATVVTTDGAPRADASGVVGTNCDTFARINDFPDTYDPLLPTNCVPVPEVNAHLALAGGVASAYPQPSATPVDDGVTPNATFRLRGSSSRFAAQKSYRIKLTKGVPLWRGESTLQLNKHPYDLSRMRNKLAMDLFRDIPNIGSLRTQFVGLSITNKTAANAPYASADFGLFTHVEKLGKEFLANRGLPSTGNIYKAEEFDFSTDARAKLVSALDANYKVTDKASFEMLLSLEADNNNHLPLVSMVGDVNNTEIPFDVTFDKYFDKANYLTWLATNILLGNRDTLNQNFALYQPKDGTKFYFLPWDYDGAFGFENQPDQAAAGPLYASWQKTVANWWGVPLHRRFLQDPKHLAELELAVNEIYAAYLTQAKIRAKTDHYKALIQTTVMAAPDVAQLPVLPNTLEPALAQWDREANRLADAVQTNLANFAAALESPMPFWLSAHGIQTSAGNKIELNWDPSVDLQGDAVTYTLQVAKDPNFVSLALPPVTVAQQGGEFPSYAIPMLPNGNYYLKVTARDSKGNTQIAFNNVDVGTAHYFGVLAFAVANGAVTP